MRRLSRERLARTIKTKREEKSWTQEELSSLTGINRVTIGRIERENFIPSIHQLEALARVLEFDITDVFVAVPGNNPFVALRGEARSEVEQEGLDKLYSMMLALRQQYLLRRKFENAANKHT